MKIAILGAGNMGSAIACGLVRSGKFQAEEIVCTARTETTLERLRTVPGCADDDRQRCGRAGCRGRNAGRQAVAYRSVDP